MAEPNETFRRGNQDGTEGSDQPPGGTGGDRAVETVPRELSCRNRSRKLVLHVDLNNTILISDAVTSQRTVAALDYFLTTVTWGRMSKHGTGAAAVSGKAIKWNSNEANYPLIALLYFLSNNLK